jgi:polysaccharide export outer membrane protein
MAVVAVLAGSGCGAPLHRHQYAASALPGELQAPPPRRASRRDLSALHTPGMKSTQIGPGDLLETTIRGGHEAQPPDPTPARVAADGTIVLPHVGPVAVAGLDASEASRAVAAAAVAREIYRQPQVDVKVVEPAVSRITVLGAVGTPGVYEIPRGACDVVGAIAAAGGLTEEAGNAIDLVQAAAPLAATTPVAGSQGAVPAAYAAPLSVAATGPQTAAFGPSGVRRQRIDLEALERTPEAARPQYWLQDQDVVMVLPREKQFFHVTGLVSKPGQFELPGDQDVRVLDAIAIAGGLSTPVANRALLIRQRPEGGEPAIVKLQLSQCKSRGEENLRLGPGDLLTVENTVATGVYEALSRLFRIGIGVSGSVSAF